MHSSPTPNEKLYQPHQLDLYGSNSNEMSNPLMDREDVKYRIWELNNVAKLVMTVRKVSLLAH